MSELTPDEVEILKAIIAERKVRSTEMSEARPEANINVRMTKALTEGVKTEPNVLGITVSELVRRFIVEGLEKRSNSK